MYAPISHRMRHGRTSDLKVFSCKPVKSVDIISPVRSAAEGASSLGWV